MAKPCTKGAIAQLGERLPCTQEVSGSIPLGSTTSSYCSVAFVVVYWSKLPPPRLALLEYFASSVFTLPYLTENRLLSVLLMH